MKQSCQLCLIMWSMFLLNLPKNLSYMNRDIYLFVYFWVRLQGHFNGININFFRFSKKKKNINLFLLINK